MTVIRVAGEAAGTDHEGFLHGGGEADLDAEFITFVGFTLADAFGFRRVQVVESFLKNIQLIDIKC